MNKHLLDCLSAMGLGDVELDIKQHPVSYEVFQRAWSAARLPIHESSDAYDAYLSGVAERIQQLIRDGDERTLAENCQALYRLSLLRRQHRTGISNDTLKLADRIERVN